VPYKTVGERSWAGIQWLSKWCEIAWKVRNEKGRCSNAKARIWISI